MQQYWINKSMGVIDIVDSSAIYNMFRLWKLKVGVDFFAGENISERAHYWPHFA